MIMTLRVFVLATVSCMISVTDVVFAFGFFRIGHGGSPGRQPSNHPCLRGGSPGRQPSNHPFLPVVQPEDEPENKNDQRAGLEGKQPDGEPSPSQDKPVAGPEECKVSTFPCKVSTFPGSPGYTRARANNGSAQEESAQQGNVSLGLFGAVIVNMVPRKHFQVRVCREHEKMTTWTKPQGTSSFCKAGHKERYGFKVKRETDRWLEEVIVGGLGTAAKLATHHALHAFGRLLGMLPGGAVFAGLLQPGAALGARAAKREMASRAEKVLRTNQHNVDFLDKVHKRLRTRITDSFLRGPMILLVDKVAKQQAVPDLLLLARRKSQSEESTNAEAVNHMKAAFKEHMEADLKEHMKNMEANFKEQAVTELEQTCTGFISKITSAMSFCPDFLKGARDAFFQRVFATFVCKHLTDDGKALRFRYQRFAYALIEPLNIRDKGDDAVVNGLKINNLTRFCACLLRTYKSLVLEASTPAQCPMTALVAEVMHLCSESIAAVIAEQTKVLPSTKAEDEDGHSPWEPQCLKDWAAQKALESDHWKTVRQLYLERKECFGHIRRKNDVLDDKWDQLLDKLKGGCTVGVADISALGDAFVEGPEKFTEHFSAMVSN